MKESSDLLWPLIISHCPVKLSSYTPCRSGNTFFICHVTSRDWRNMWFCALRHLVISPFPVKVGGQKPSGSEDLTFLICNKASCDHRINGLCDFVDNKTSARSEHYVKLGSHKPSRGGDVSLFIGHVAFTWLIKGSSDFLRWPTKSGGNKSCGSTDIIFFNF